MRVVVDWKDHAALGSTLGAAREPDFGAGLSPQLSLRPKVTHRSSAALVVSPGASHCWKHGSRSAFGR